MFPDDFQTGAKKQAEARRADESGTRASCVMWIFISTRPS